MIPISYPSSRVSQLDACILDGELFSLLKDQVSSIFQSHENSNSTFNKLSYSRHPETYSLLLSLVIFKLTVWKSGATYGSALQNLKLTDSKSGKIIGLNKKGLLLAALVGTFAYKKIETLLYQLDEEGNNGEYDSFSNRIKNFLINNRNKMFTKIDNTLKILNLVNFTIFLVNGKYSTLYHRILGITETPLISDLLKFNGSNVNYEFQNRQLVWNVMTEFLVFLLPLLQLRKLGKLVNKVLNRTKVADEFSFSIGESARVTRYTNLPISECAICHYNNFQASQSGGGSGGRVFATAGPVTNPCITNCGHVYCYVCLATQFNLMQASDESLPCLRCERKLEWFQEFEADEKAFDVEAIVVETENVDEDEEEKEEEGEEEKGDEGGEGDEEGFHSDDSGVEIDDFKPINEHVTTRLERRLSQRSEIFAQSSSEGEEDGEGNGEDDDEDEDEESDYSEEEEMDADELM
ncbi:uncharacterized protein LODBEIA_P04700 [Lodderomyces beijingensis]|uniref:RING-type domain-containing protein n=1 Tax=Lodderomyces beijingensis TaxID=1775926 RepID=A0ABP0ZGH4_9ASCO